MLMYISLFIGVRVPAISPYYLPRIGLCQLFDVPSTEALIRDAVSNLGVNADALICAKYSVTSSFIGQQQILKNSFPSCLRMLWSCNICRNSF